MARQIYQIQIALKGFTPKIWRRVLVHSDELLPDLHDIIQIVMGWEDSHLHQFVKNNIFYSESNEEWDMGNTVDYEKIKISDLLEKPKDKMIYTYDFGDSWDHEIVLEKILPNDHVPHCPICIAGKMACPSEDCGGVWGYAEMLETIKDPKHEDYEDTMEWLGEDFNPELFDIDDVNMQLGVPK